MARLVVGIGLIVVGMSHHSWDVQLTAYAARDWRANFFPVGNCALRRWQLGVGADAVGAVQLAAWGTLNRVGT